MREEQSHRADVALWLTQADDRNHAARHGRRSRDALRWILRYFNVAGADPLGRAGQSTVNGTLRLASWTYTARYLAYVVIAGIMAWPTMTWPEWWADRPGAGGWMECRVLALLFPTPTGVVVAILVAGITRLIRRNGHVLAFDNFSGLPPFSCRIPSAV